MIPDIKEVNFPEGVTLAKATVTLANRGDRTIEAQVSIDAGIVPDFSYDWVAEFRGEEYVHPLKSPEASKDNEKFDPEYSLVFRHRAIEDAKRYFFAEMTHTPAGAYIPSAYDASLSLPLPQFVDYADMNLRHYFGGALRARLHGEGYSEEPVTIEMSDIKIWDAMLKIAEEFGVGLDISRDEDGVYWFDFGKAADELDHIFEYGFKGGLAKVERQVQDPEITNVLLGRGGEKNIPAYYFKNAPEGSPFRSDPDAIEELSLVTFTNLMDYNFRLYAQGWKDRGGARRYPVGAESAYDKGYTDEVFFPVEWVKDEKSIRKYGEIWGKLENNDEIYPSIRGVSIDGIGRVDQCVAAEKVLTDDVDEASQTEAVEYDIEGVKVSSATLKSNDVVELTVVSENFTIEEGMTANLSLQLDCSASSVYVSGLKMIMGQWTVVYSSEDASSYTVFVGNPIVKVYDAVTGEETGNGGINLSGGIYRYEVTAKIRYTHPKSGKVTLETKNVHIAKRLAGVDPRAWSGTFDVWVKNIWNTAKQTYAETDEQYAERVWRPILGDRLGNEAKLVFASGMLSFSEDYEFTIVSFPVHDTTKTLDGVPSHWRLTLAKSDAELSATGKYIPNAMTNAENGDYFFFTGIEPPHDYVVWKEKALRDYKTDQLGEYADINPTWSVEVDSVRIGQPWFDETEALIDKLTLGAKVRLYSKWFVSDPDNKEGETYQTFIQSLTFEYGDGALTPKVSVTLADKPASGASRTSLLEGEVSALSRQIGSLSGFEQAFRFFGDKVYLRKDGIEDLSLSPTRFNSLVASKDFRQGDLGGRGWGIYRSGSGAAVLEVDEIVARKSFRVNNLVANQITTMGGKDILSAANMVFSNVVKVDEGVYRCYFDQKEGSVANNYKVNDIVLCERFSPENRSQKYYKAVVTEWSVDSITIELGGDATGAPEKGDVTCQYGNTSDPDRQFVIVRDAIGGAYERMIEGLNDLYAEGEAYFFAGKEIDIDGNLRAYRLFIGDKSKDYLEWKDGELNVKGRLRVSSTGQTIEDYVGSRIGDASTAILDLTDENVSVPCDADGNPTIALSTVKTEVAVYVGSGKATDWQFSKTDSGCVSTLNGGTLSLASLTTDRATVTVTATKAGASPLTTVWSISKVRAGADGQPAVIFSIDVSVNSITKSYDGELSATEVSATKIKTTGDSAREPTTLKTLKYYRVGVDNEEHTLPGVGGAVQITDKTEAVVFKLYDDDGATVLDRERVPVLSDASGLEVDGRNILTLTNRGATNWWHTMQVNGKTPNVELRGTTINDIYKTNAVEAVRLPDEEEDNDENGDGAGDEEGPSWEVLMFLFDRYRFEKDKDYVLSFDISIDVEGMSLKPLIGTADGKFAVDATLSPYETLTKGKVNHIERRFAATKDGTSLTTNPRFGVYLDFYGKAGEWESIKIWNLKLEQGNAATPWSPAPEDADLKYGFLTKALSESTEIEGGLVQTSLIRLGYTDAIGRWIPTAGTSGLSVNGERSLSIWAGGDMIDPESDPENGSAFGVRLDGSVYAANNQVRFTKEGRMEMGDSLVVDESGLHMDAAGSQPLFIGDKPVANASELMTQSVFNFTGTNSQSVIYRTWELPALPNESGLIQIGRSYTNIVSNWTSQRTATSLTENSAINVSVLVSINLPKDDVELGDNVYLHASATVGLRLKRNGVVLQDVRSSATRRYVGSNPLGYLESKLSINYVIPMGTPASDYTAEFYFPAAAPGEGAVNTDNKSVTVGVTWSGQAAKVFHSATMIGNNGFASIWENSGFLVNDSVVLGRVGNFVMRISGSGVQVSLDSGNTWKYVQLTDTPPS